MRHRHPWDRRVRAEALRSYPLEDVVRALGYAEQPALHRGRNQLQNPALVTGPADRPATVSRNSVPRPKSGEYARFYAVANTSKRRASRDRFRALGRPVSTITMRRPLRMADAARASPEARV